MSESPDSPRFTATSGGRKARITSILRGCGCVFTKSHDPDCRGPSAARLGRQRRSTDVGFAPDPGRGVRLEDAFGRRRSSPRGRTPTGPRSKEWRSGRDRPGRGGPERLALRYHTQTRSECQESRCRPRLPSEDRKVSHRRSIPLRRDRPSYCRDR